MDLAGFNPDNPLAPELVIPAQAGIQQEYTAREADKTLVLTRYAGIFASWAKGRPSLRTPIQLTGFPPARE